MKDEVVKAVEFRVNKGKLQYRSLIVYIENSFNSDGYLSYEKELRVGQGEFSEWENVPEISEVVEEETIWDIIKPKP